VSDPYAILGISASATDAEVRAAYRRLVQRHHPDHNGGSREAARRFEEVQEAYEVLRDPEKRAAYDQLGHEMKGGQEFRPPPDWASDLEVSCSS